MSFIPNQWYPVLESHELKKKPLAVERLAEKLVFWRSEHGVHCFQDRCPHLGAALSQGVVRDGLLICPFHGFEFAEKGQCTLIPANGSDGKIPSGMAAHTYEAHEAHGMIWIWWGEPQTKYPELPFFKELENWSYATTIADWPVHISRAIENQLDVAHIPFIHKTTIGKNASSFVQGPLVESSLKDIKVWNDRSTTERHLTQTELRAKHADRPSDLHFLFPGIWRLRLGDHLRNLIFFVPINEQQTRYYLRVYHRFNIPILKNIFESLMNVSNRFILNQDRWVVVGQRPLNTAEVDDEHFIGADRAILQYRQLSQRLSHP